MDLMEYVYEEKKINAKLNMIRKVEYKNSTTKQLDWHAKLALCNNSIGRVDKFKYDSRKNRINRG